MMRYLPTPLVFLVLVATSLAQESSASKPPAPNPTANTITAPAINANSTPLELARAALAAQGGAKFKDLKSMSLFGSVDLYAPNSSQSIPGKFAMVTAGERVRIDIDARPVFAFKQIYDGQQSYTSMPGVQLPPASKFGLAVLAKYDQPGYTVSALANLEKLRGFRIADADGNTTDFYVELSTARVVKYLIPYNGYTFGTEHTKVKEVDGVLVPFNFSQRMEMTQGTFFAVYKVKDVKLNQPIGDDVFVMQ